MMDGNKWLYECKPTSNNMNDMKFPNDLNDSFKKTQVWRPKALKSPKEGDQISHQCVCIVFAI
jgi:hypothetical protein